MTHSAEERIAAINDGWRPSKFWGGYTPERMESDSDEDYALKIDNWRRHQAEFDARNSIDLHKFLQKQEAEEERKAREFDGRQATGDRDRRAIASVIVVALSLVCGTIFGGNLIGHRTETDRIAACVQSDDVVGCLEAVGQ